MKTLQFTYLFFFLLGMTACKTSKNISTTNIQNHEYPSTNQVKGERLYFNGLKEKQKENYSAALKNFEQAVKLHPQIDAAYYEMAIIYYSQNNYEEALLKMEKALKIDNSNHWYKELFAELLSANKKYDKAAKVYKKLKEEFPHNVDYYYSEAYFLLKQNKSKEALVVYNLLEEKIGIQEEITNEKYLIHLKQSNFLAAEKELEKLIDAYPTNLKYLNKLASFELSNNKPEKAITIFEKILKINPDDTKALMSLADYYRQTGNEEKYKKYSKQAFENKNINIDTKIAILYSYIKESEKDSTKLNDAFEYAELLSKTHPEDAKVWAIYGDLYNLDKKEEEALKMYQKSLAIRKDIYSVWQQVFFIESDAKKYDLLIKDTENAMELFPNQALVYFFNGLAYQQQKSYEKSNKSYDKAIKLTTKNPNLKSQIYSNLGENYNDLKQYEESDKNFEKSLEIDANNQYVLNNYAYYLSLREENLERAKEMSLKSLELSPENPTYLDTYAWILFKNGEFEEAFKNQKKAIDLSEKPSAALYEHLGDMLFKLNKIDEAVINWKKAIKKGNDSKELLNKITHKKLD